MFRKETLAAFFDSSPEVLVISDTEGNLLLSNQQASGYFGYEENEFKKLCIGDLLADVSDAAQILSAEKSRLVSTKKKDGAVFFSEMNSRPVNSEDGCFIIYSFHDITDQNKSELEENNLLAQAIRKLPEGTQIIDKDFRYLFVNDTVVKQSKFSREELIGFTMMEKYPGIENTRLFRLLKESFADQTPRSFLNEFTYPDQSVGYFQLKIEPIPKGLLIISMEITEFVLFRQELIDKNRKLVLMNTELEQFAYIASHDLQEPLKTVSSCVRMLKKKLGDNLEEESEQYLRFIGIATDRMQNLIHALLEYSYLGKKSVREKIDCAEILEQVQSDMQATISETNCQFEIGPMPQISVNSSELRMVFQNLISNAIKFRNSKNIPKISITCNLTDEKWLFSVADNGIGIEKKHLSKIFAIFQRLHLRNEYEGTGIGLAHCRKIIQLHGGEIWAESIPGSGTCFYFTIPKAINV